MTLLLHHRCRWRAYFYAAVHTIVYAAVRTIVFCLTRAPVADSEHIIQPLATAAHSSLRSNVITNADVPWLSVGVVYLAPKGHFTLALIRLSVNAHRFFSAHSEKRRGKQTLRLRPASS